MTFQARKLLICANNQFLRFIRKNSFIDIPLQTFQEVATFKGDIAVYRVPYNNDVITLNWSVRKSLKTVQCMLYRDIFCTQEDLVYLQSGRYTLTYASDSIVIITLQFFNDEVRQNLCKLLELQLNISVKCIFNVKDTIFAFSTLERVSNLVITAGLNQILKEQNICVIQIESRHSTEYEYYVSLTMRE